MLLGCSNRWFAERYNVNNAWNFNGTNRNLNNNNVNNANQVGAIANLLEKLLRKDEFERRGKVCQSIQADEEDKEE